MKTDATPIRKPVAHPPRDLFARNANAYGKGSHSRVDNLRSFRDNYDSIFKKKKR